MAVGDVDVSLVQDATASSIDTQVTTMRTSADDHWLFIPINNGKDVFIANIEEV